ncbi:hypothetical protein K1719_002792 [Acacia pycnantha]|nr:hypothetical protein K1719_002792 [Acacia pycnantha]
MYVCFNASKIGWNEGCRPVIGVDGTLVKGRYKVGRKLHSCQTCRRDLSMRPKCVELFESNRFLAADCRIFFNGDEGYEVVEGRDRHIANIARDPKTHISHYYHKDTYVAAYRSKFQPVRGKKFWDTTNFGPLQPPIVTKLPGRPPTKRTRTDEPERRRKKARHCRQRGATAPPSREEQLKAAAARQSNSTPNSQQPTSQATQQQCGSDSLNSQQPPQPTQEEPTSQSSGLAASHAQPSTRRTSTRRARSGVSGFGIRFDETTGRSVYNYAVGLGISFGRYIFCTAMVDAG